jgi:hypothetical protein
VGPYESEGRTTEDAVQRAIELLNKQDRTEIAHVVIDPVAMFILGITSKRCMTVSDISPSVNLPIATCYKLVYQMENLGLMTKCGASRTTGRGKAATYTSVMKSINLDIKASAINLLVTWKNGQTMLFKKDMNTMINEPGSCIEGYEKDFLPQQMMDQTKIDEINEFEPNASLLGKRAKVF